MTTPGQKFDKGKPRVGLVLTDFSNALMEVSKVGTFGAVKYTEHGWLYVDQAVDRYNDALFRHLLANTLIDAESGLSHTAHAAWNALAVLELTLRKNK